MKRLNPALLLLFSCYSVQAHHSFSAEFDSDKWITVSGTVVEVRFRNPHVQYFIDVEESGETARWVVAGQNMTVMRRSGVTGDTISIGDEITISGYAGRNGAKKVYLDTLVTASGTRYAMYGDPANRRRTASASTIEHDSNSPLLDALAGDWAFDVDKPLPGAPLHLSFERKGDRLQAELDYEVLDTIVGEDSLVITLERENRAGFPAQLQLTGRLVDGEIQGSVELTAGYSNFAELDASSFSAVRMPATKQAADSTAASEPADLSGIWTRKIVLGPIGRTNPALTEAGQARHEAYKKGAYDPLLRCIEVGPMRRQARRGDLEIISLDNRLVFLYANDNGIRRIWLDRTEHTTGRDHDMMGESLGHWEGSTLVIDTRKLSEAVLTHNAEPISADARIVEKLWLNDDGDLVMEAVLHDPKYYQRPVAKRLLWTRSDNADMLYAPCDPDSFYRGLHFDGELDNYFENQPPPADP
jgi:hypothetical protein